MSWLCITARREVGQGLSDDDDGDSDDNNDDDDDVAGLVFVSRLGERLGKVLVMMMMIMAMITMTMMMMSQVWALYHSSERGWAKS